MDERFNTKQNKMKQPENPTIGTFCNKCRNPFCICKQTEKSIKERAEVVLNRVETNGELLDTNTAIKAMIVFHEQELSKLFKEAEKEWPDNYDLQRKIDELPYTKHLDDGQYNDGQIHGFEQGWDIMKEKATKIIAEKNEEIKRLNAIIEQDEFKKWLDNICDEFPAAGENITIPIKKIKEKVMEIESKKL